MSYNTRRAAGGRGSPTTQVNYHQQPNRTPGSNTTQQNRSGNPGYSTSQQPVTYNSAAQPAYSTPAYTTTPPVPPAPSQQQQQQQQQQQAPPPPPTTPVAKPAVTSTTTPVLKQEPVTPADTPKMDTTENGDNSGAKTPFWKKRPFVKVSNKVRRARQNAKLRRILNPKNALTFLNELRPGTGKFVVREDPNWGGYVATVEVDGKTFTGHGLGASKAKVQASEKALKHLLLEQLSKSQQAANVEVKEEKEDEPMETSEQEGEESKAKKPKILPEDDVPWGSLAAFALHKLFTEWQKEGPIETPLPQTFPAEKVRDPIEYDEDVGEEQYFARRPPGPPEFGYRGRGYPPYPGRGRGFGPYPPPRGPPPPGYGLPPPGRRLPPSPATVAAFATAPRQPLPGGAAMITISNLVHGSKQRRKEKFDAEPMKKIPEDANQRHPVMLLNQLKPNVIYNESREGEQPRVTFVITIEIDGKQYVGRGKNKKEAKKQAAKAALAPMGIIYNEED